MQLGFFSFAKLLMLHDLDPENWDGAGLEDHPLLTGLLETGFTADPPLFAPGERLDERVAPADLIHVVPADASQTKVIEEVRAGRNLVVQGPPGTGKSQTIANIVAGAAHDGKTVLFVAEKMAALQVVHDRLQKVGLGDLCLEVHSRAANKKAFLQELARTLNAGQDVPARPGPPEALTAARDRLNTVTKLLHEPVPGRDWTPFRALAEIVDFVGREVAPPRLPADGLVELDDAARRAAADLVGDMAELLAQSGPRSAHPFAGAQAADLQPTDLQRLATDLGAAQDAVEAVQALADDVCSEAGLPAAGGLDDAKGLEAALALLAHRPHAAAEAAGALMAHAGAPRLAEGLEAGREWREARQAAEARFTEAAFETPADALRARLLPGVGSFWKRLFGSYRGASAELAVLLKEPLPKAPVERLALVDDLLDIRRKRGRLADEEGWLREALGGAWRGERTDFAGLEAACGWLDAMSGTGWVSDAETLDRLSALSAEAEALAADLRTRIDTAREAVARVTDRLRWADPTGREVGAIPLPDLSDRLAGMADNLDRYGEWARLLDRAERLRAAGLGALLDALDTGTLAPEAAVDEFLYATAEARWAEARGRRPELDRLAQLDRHALVEEFRALEDRRLKETRQLVHARHLAQLPQGAVGEMGFLRGEMAKKRKHRPIRRIIEQAGGMVQRIKPVFLMSPISIAQFLPPGAVEFDLLVIDEASQVRPEEALGAIARCRQIVVVGDQKQLPPTSFFDRLAAEAEDEDDEEVGPRTARATEMESVLTLCEARGLNPGMLEWHYRSRDPSLITVNNAEFYDHRLVLPPSPVQDDPGYGLAFTRVPGVYSSATRGGGRPTTNRIEAEAVARRLAEHARARPDLSVGIVAFSKAQSDMVTEVLELARREDAVLDDFLREGRAEDVFVKNIENVQGDERDVILISVGYGPHEPDGRLASMSFGPVNGEGGERRLNVLFSRARTRCEIFCSFDPGDIDPSRSSREGPRVLKRFLEYARSGELHQPEPTGDGADSPFEADIARVIASLGYPCDAQVGSAGFRIDLGVRHPERPGQYILAVECDGATYHGALWARERDRLRQDVLEGMGWRFLRIWSTDWFHRRAHEIDRLRAALDAARAAETTPVRGANEGGRVVEEEIPEPAEPEVVEVSAPALTAEPYRRAELRVASDLPPHEAPTGQLADLVCRIVAVEGPVHREEVGRRVTAAFGLSRAGRRIQEATDRAVGLAVRDGRLLALEAFVMTVEQRAAPQVRDRSAESTPTTRAEYLPPIEIRAAAERILAESGRMDHDALVVATARLLGFARTGQEVRTVIGSAISDLVRQG